MPKLVTVASAGKAATDDTKEETPRCVGCKSVTLNFVRCPTCASGCYCSVECVENHREEHELICGAIVALDEIESGKMYRELKQMEMAGRPKENKEIIDLVGEKPLVEICLQGIPLKCLWDTGSQISVISRKLLNKYWPGRKLHSMVEFLGRKLGVSTANNTELPVEGIVLLDFLIGDISFTVPFLVTKEDLSNTIIGSNIMKHLILKCIEAGSLPSLKKLLPTIPAENIELLIAAIKAETQQPEILGQVKLSENIVIPAHHMVHTRGKTRVQLGAEECDVLFSPAAEFLGEQDLIIYETTEKLKGGKSQFVTVVVSNPTSHELHLKKGTVVGSVSDVNTIIQFPAKERKQEVVQSNSVGVDYASDEDTVEEKPWYENLDLSELSEEEAEEALEMLLEEHEVFSKSKNDIGHVPDFQIPINLTDNTPVSESYRSIPRPLYDDVKNHINNLLAHGWVRKSSSSYASPMVCARKKDGSLRLCIDFRRLNAKTIPFKQPIPRVQDILDGLKGQVWFSTLDMSQAYHQGEITEECRKFTAFSTPWSLLEWVRIPYGLSNAPPYFQQFINETLQDLKDRICVAFLDDILIFGKTFKEHKRNVRTVIQCLKKKGIKLNPKKCYFFKKEVRYLGRLISKDGYRPDPENTAALDACLKTPRTIGNLRSLLGFLGYYRDFVMDFSRKMKPVYELLKVEEAPKDKRALSRKVIKWLPEHQKIVEEVVTCLKSPEVIAFPDFNQEFFIHCDASNSGLGGVLYQQQEEKLRVISYASRTLSPAELNYNLHSGKLEFLALKWCVTEKFKDYLHYGPRFTVFTDNNPLTYVQSTAKLNAAGLRWVSQLADYQFDIKYRPGKQNIDADYLSRHPVGAFEQRLKEENEVIRAEDVGVIFSEAARKDRLVVGSNSLDLKLFATDVTTPPENVPRITREQLSREQMADEIISPIMNAMLENRPVGSVDSRESKLLAKQRGKLSVEDGVLYRRTATHKQIVLPKILRAVVFRELHNNMGHLGSERVWELAKKRFYWPYMRRDIDLYVRKQCRCLISKTPNVADRAPLVPISSSRPFELISMDLVGLDPCKGGFTQVLVVCDHFTRFTQFYPMKNKSAKSAAEHVFNKFILQYGLPERIHHDQGTEFENRLFHRLQQLMGIASSRTTPYHPQGDGQVERMNRTLINLLKCLDEQEKGDWAKHLGKLAFSYNTTTHKSTGFSPFFLLMGREPVLPVDWVFGIDVEAKASYANKTYTKFVEDWTTSMQQALDIARKNSTKSGEYNKEYYDRKLKGTQIVVGDKVLCRNREKGGTGKLRSHWENKVYNVVDIQPDIPVLTVQDENGGKQKRIHRNNVMRCNEFVQWEQDQKQQNQIQQKHIQKPSQLQNQQQPKPQQKQVQNKHPQQTHQKQPKHVQQKLTQNSQNHNTDKFKQINQNKQQLCRSSQSTAMPTPVVDYTSSESDEDEMVVLVPVSGGGVGGSETDDNEVQSESSSAGDDVSHGEANESDDVPCDISTQQEDVRDVEDNLSNDSSSASESQDVIELVEEVVSDSDEPGSDAERDSAVDSFISSSPSRHDSTSSTEAYEMSDEEPPPERSQRIRRPPQRYSPS